MKREIKFRGRKLSGEWVIGDLITDAAEDRYILCPDYKTDLLYHKVDPNTTGQYIGKKDKNGKEIYEGDILQYNSLFRPSEYYRYVIAWNPMDMAFGCASLEHAFLDCPDICGRAQITDSIIVGNVHDNPELLKGGIK